MALNKKCICGRFDVRMVSTGNRSRYMLPESTSGHHWPGYTPTFIMKPAGDGLCDRCRHHGVPESTVRELRSIDAKFKGASNAAQSRRAIDSIKFIPGDSNYA